MEWWHGERMWSVVVALGTLLALSACDGNSTDEGDTGSPTSGPDGSADVQVDGTSSDAGADGKSTDATLDGGETSSTPWFERDPQTSQGDEQITGYVFSNYKVDKSKFQALVQDGDSRRLAKNVRTLNGDVSFVAKSGGWILLDKGDGKQLLISSPWDLVNPVHKVDIADDVGKAITDVVYHPGLNTTFFLAGGKPTLFAVEHDAGSDTIQTMDLTTDGSDANPDPDALAVDGETLLIGLSRLYPDDKQTDQDVGEPARILVVDAAARSVEATVDLPKTNVTPGFDRLPNGDFAVGLQGDRLTEPDSGGFTGAAPDGGIYRLKRAGEGDYSVGEQILSEKTLEANIIQFAFLDSAVGVVESFSGTQKVERFDVGGSEPKVTLYKAEGSGRTGDFCVGPNGQMVGVTTHTFATSSKSEKFLVYEKGQTDQSATHVPSFEGSGSCLLVGSGE